MSSTSTDAACHPNASQHVQIIQKQWKCQVHLSRSRAIPMPRTTRHRGHVKYIDRLCMPCYCFPARRDTKKQCPCWIHLPILHPMLMPWSMQTYSTTIELLSTSAISACHVHALKPVITYSNNAKAKYIYQVRMLYQCPDTAQNNTNTCQVHLPIPHVLMSWSTSQYSESMQWFNTSSNSACHANALKHVININNRRNGK
jgi:hypothetical protein